MVPRSGEVLRFGALSDRLAVLVPLNNAVAVDAVGASWTVAPGQTVVIPQNVSFAVKTSCDDSVFALHVVSSELALKDWRQEA